MSTFLLLIFFVLLAAAAIIDTVWLIPAAVVLALFFPALAHDGRVERQWFIDQGYTVSDNPARQRGGEALIIGTAFLSAAIAFGIWAWLIPGVGRMEALAGLTAVVGVPVFAYGAWIALLVLLGRI